MVFETHTIAGHRDGPRLLVTAGVHGDEWEAVIAVRRLVTTLQRAELRGSVTLVPVLNVPAYRAGQRVGADGLDLARTCPGRREGSPTEQIAFEFAQLLENYDYFIDLHTGGVRLTIWPLAGYLLHQDPKVLEKQRMMARAFGLPAIWGTDPTVQGRTISIARDRSIPAIYVEYLGSGVFCAEAVDAMTRGCRQVMAALDMLPADGAPSSSQYFAEDCRAGSGHLQVCHPAVSDGLFEPVVRPGDAVVAGEAVGFLTPDDSNDRALVPADSDGRVIAIRSLPRVRTGDALAVVAAFQEIN